MKTFTLARVAITVMLMSPASLWAQGQVAFAAASSGGSGASQVEYSTKKGPTVIVLPGQFKSNNPAFREQFGTNNIADFAESELRRAHFGVLERADLESVIEEIDTAFSLGDQTAARKVMGRGKLKTTKWILKFDILQAEQVAQSTTTVNGGKLKKALGSIFKRTKGGIEDSVQAELTSGVWRVGMRYRVVNASTTDQVADGFITEEQEIGRTHAEVAGIATSTAEELTLDSMVQRLVQKCVLEIDGQYK